MKNLITYFCAEQGMTWNSTPEHAVHFGRLWKAAVKSFKRHLRHTCIIGGVHVRLTFKELATTLTQIEACLNSRPLTVISNSDKGKEA